MRPVTLSPRLQALARQVPCGVRFADIGTDHARLPVWLLEHDVIPWAIAPDLREGPLEQARQLVLRHNLAERVSLRLGDGLAPIRPEEVDWCAISGMGGETISAILSAAPWVLEKGIRFLLQPMTSVQDLRGWLWRNGFCIEQEALIQEGDTLYVSLTVLPGPMPPLSPVEEWAGRQYRGMEAPLRKRYLERLSDRVEGALAGLRCSTRAEDRCRVSEWEDLSKGLDQMRKEWEAWQQ